MARSGKMSVLKRQRERQKAEKAARKREERLRSQEEGERSGGQEATQDDLAGYGLLPEEDDESREEG